MMKKNAQSRYLSISEFSKISNVSRKALIFYDNIGLFSPDSIGSNGYRYYSHEQIYLISVINTLKELGMPLSAIKTYMANRTPDDAIVLLEQQNEFITQKIRELQGVQDMLATKLQKLRQGAQIADTKIRLVKQEETPIFISDPIEKEKNDIYDDEWVNFYVKCQKYHVTFGYPEGFLVCKNNLLTHQTDIADHIICHVGNTRYANSSMPEGNYAVACGRGSFQDTSPIYERLLNYIHENQLEITGHAYETRLIDEAASKNPDLQIIQVCIQVR